MKLLLSEPYKSDDLDKIEIYLKNHKDPFDVLVVNNTNNVKFNELRKCDGIILSIGWEKITTSVIHKRFCVDNNKTIIYLEEVLK